MSVNVYVCLLQCLFSLLPPLKLKCMAVESNCDEKCIISATSAFELYSLQMLATHAMDRLTLKQAKKEYNGTRNSTMCIRTVLVHSFRVVETYQLHLYTATTGSSSNYTHTNG